MDAISEERMDKRVIKHDKNMFVDRMSHSVSLGYPNTEKRVENTMRSGVFLTKIEVFG